MKVFYAIKFQKIDVLFPEDLKSHKFWKFVIIFCLGFLWTCLEVTDFI